MTCLGHRRQEEASAALRSEGTSGGSSYYNPREVEAQEKSSSQELSLGKGIQPPSRGDSAGRNQEVSHSPSPLALQSSVGLAFDRTQQEARQAGVQLMQPMQVVQPGLRRVYVQKCSSFCMTASSNRIDHNFHWFHFWSTKHF